MKLFVRLSLAVVVVLIVTALVFSFGKQPQPFSEGSRSASMLKQGPYQVASHDEMLVDNSRTTQANGDFPAKNKRTIDTTIWYPVEANELVAGRHPLIIYSHGFSSMKEGGAHLGEYLASHGYIVVAADYPLTNFYAEGGPMVEDVVNQPADVSFLIDTLLQWSNSEDHQFSASIDSKRIGVTGVSLGGLTTTLAAFHPELRDPRIVAAASIAGPLNMFKSAFFEHHQMPFMMLATDQDALVDYQANARPVLTRIKGAQLVTVAGGSHTGFSATAKHLRWLDNPDSMGCDMVLKNIDMEQSEGWNGLLGTAEQGVIEDPASELCTMMPLPPAMNVLRQHMLLKVAVGSFFQSQFAEDADQRNDYARYLSQDMAKELAEVSYEAAAN